MRRLTRRQKGKRKKQIIMVLTICFLFVMVVGYAAFSTNLNLKAKGNIRDRNNLYVASYGSDIDGRGTKEKPYATIQKAYDNAWESATIYIMTDLQISETVLFDKNKTVTLQSETDNHKLTRDNMTEYILMITTGETTITNLTLDGENKEANESLLRVEGTETNICKLNLGENVIIQNNIDTEDHGGGASWRYSNVTIDGAKFLNNVASYGGGGFISRFSDVTINYAEIIGNEAGDGGAMFFGDNTLTINNILVQNNKSIEKHGMGTNSGGIELRAATMNMYNGKIINNTTTGTGGGIFAGSGNDVSQDVGSTLNLYNGEIYSNIAELGGGVYISKISTFTNQSANIQNNIPDNIYYSNME